MDGWSVSEPSFSYHKAGHQLQSDAFCLLRHISAMRFDSHCILYYSIHLHVWGVKSINSIILRKYYWIPDSQVVTVSLFMANVSFADPQSTWQTFSVRKQSGGSSTKLSHLKIGLRFPTSCLFYFINLAREFSLGNLTRLSALSRAYVNHVMYNSHETHLKTVSPKQLSK